MDTTDQTPDYDWLDPEMTLSAVGLRFRRSNLRDRKLAIIGAAQQGELGAIAGCMWVQFEFDCPSRAPVELAWPDPHYDPQYVGSSAFTYQLAHSDAFWSDGATLEQRAPFTPRELEGKWSRHFSDTDRDQPGALVWYATGVRFNAEQLYALLLDRQWKARGNVLLGQGSVRRGRGAPARRPWKVVIASVIAQMALRPRQLGWAATGAEIANHLADEMRQAFIGLDRKSATPARRELLDWANPIAEAIVLHRRNRRNIKALTAPTRGAD